MLASTLVLTSCGKDSVNKDSVNDNIIGKFNEKIESGIMTPEILQSFGRLSGVQVSPNMKSILYGVTYVSVKENKSNRELFIMDINGENNRQLTNTPKGEQSAVWYNEGKQIMFISTESGSPQIWVMDANGGNRKQISDYKDGINGFLLSPDQKKLMFFTDIKYGKTVADIYPDLDKATGTIHNDLMYKHWDEWVTTVPHPYIADISENGLKNITDIMPGETFECPMKPFSGAEDFSWSPDGKSLAYTCRKKEGLEYSISTNSDIYIYNIEKGTTVNITEGMMGYDTHPEYSPSGNLIAWTSMERDGYESDQIRLFIMDLKTGEKKYLTQFYDNNVDNYIWGNDDNTMYFISVNQATAQVFSLDVNTRDIKQLTEGIHDFSSLAFAGNELITTKRSMSSPDEIYSVSLKNGDIKQLSFENKHILDQLTLGKVEKRWIKTTSGEQMLTWVMLPVNFDPNKKYPALLYCQGGPQSAVSQFWSYRWNIQMMAANGYVVVLPNRHGVPGFGQAWNEQISGDYPGQNMQDYFSAINEVKKEAWVDENRLGAVGASYGGFSVYWLAGNHNNLFKTFISHAGIFNLEAQYLETEELWFANWDMGGNFWDKSNKIAQRTYANSPHKFIDKWNTPILIIHGEKDYRILASQGMMAFNAAKIKGIPTEMLIFPDENHWITQPQNSVLWQRVFFGWLDKWLKN